MEKITFINNDFLLNSKKKITLTLLSSLIGLSMLTGCGKDESKDYTKVSSEQIMLTKINQEMLDNLDLDSNMIEVSFTDLDNLDFLKNSTAKYIILKYNLLDNIDELYNHPDLVQIDITGNSVKELDITKFPKLERLKVSGNYNLYTRELLDYCKSHDIATDLNEEEISYIESIKEELKDLDLSNLSKIDKFKKIYNHVLDTMEFDPNLKKFITTADMIDQAYEYNCYPEKYASEHIGICINYVTKLMIECQLNDINIYRIGGYNEKVGHAWTLTEIDGEYFLSDPTWSDDDKNLYTIFNNTLIYDLVGDNYTFVSGKDTKKFLQEHKEHEMPDGNFSPYIIKSDKAYNDVNYNDDFVDRVLSTGFLQKLDTSHDNKRIIVEAIIAAIIGGGLILLTKSTTKKIKEKLESRVLESELEGPKSY